MKNKLIIKKDNIIAFFIWFLLCVMILINFNLLQSNSRIIVIAFLIFELMVSFLSKDIRRSIPMIIIQITGAIRYIVIPIVIGHRINEYSNEIMEIMILELVGVYFGTIIYSLFNKNISKEKILKISGKTNQRLGLSAFITLLIGGVFVMLNKSYLERYFSLSTSKSVINDVSGGISLIVYVFFLILFIKCLEFIYRLPLKKELIKVVLSIFISVFFINGSAITGSNVSRWTMIISAIIVFIYIVRLYPNYKKRMSVILIGCIIFTISIGSLLKFGNSNNGYNDLKSIFKEGLKYKTLNAYFAGNKNMEVALELNNEIDSLNISRVQIFISDLFANFPVINKYLSNPQRQSVVLFNYKYYNSAIACDQILPYSMQMYIFFKYLFVIFEMIQIYFALKLYFKIRDEDDFLKIYNLVYLTFSFSLVNCINLSIILQNIWIHVLPIFIIYIFNIQLKTKNNIEKGM